MPLKRIHSVIVKRKPPAKQGEFVVSNDGGSSSSFLHSAPRFSPQIFTAISVLAVAVGVHSIFFTQAATPTTANLWIDNAQGIHNCQRVDTAESYTSAQSGNRTCNSMQQATGSCSGVKADVIVMKASTSYGAQNANAAVASPGCTVIAENGTTVSGLSLSGSRVEVQNLTSTGPSSLDGSYNTLRNVEFSGARAWLVFGGTNDKWIGGSMHGLHAQYGSGLDEPIDIFEATNAVIDGVEIYGITRTPDADEKKNPHLEIIRIDRGSTNTTIQNSYFHDNDENTGTIFWTQTVSPDKPTLPPSGLTLLNNRFADNPTGSTNLAMGNTVACTTVLIAYNTFLGGTNGVACSSAQNVRWIGNLGAHAMFNCVGSFSYNVWQDQNGTPCNATTDTLVVGTRYKHDLLGLGGTDGFHLVSGSPAINKGEPPSATSICAPTGGAGLVTVLTDAFGGTRPTPAGSRCDAGAHEYGSIPTPTDKNPPIVNIIYPHSGDSLGGSTGITATATEVSLSGDPISGVASVQFKVDGNNVGSLVITPDSGTTDTYSIPVWDSGTIPNGNHVITAVARDVAGNTATSPPIAITVTGSTIPPDTPPTTTINTTASGTPSSSTTSSSATLTFTANETSTFQCKLDTAVYSACSSPKAYTGLSVGTHTFSVLATDTAGNVEATAKTYSWTITTTTNTCSTKPGNANTDSVVNIQDIATVLSNYGKTVPTGTTNCADVNNDKIINIQDIAYILGRYGT